MNGRTMTPYEKELWLILKIWIRNIISLGQDLKELIIPWEIPGKIDQI